MHAKYEVSISYGSKVIAKVKVDNRQTHRQTDKQDKNNMPPIIWSGGIKIGFFVGNAPKDSPPDIYVTWSNPRMTDFENCIIEIVL